MSTKSTRPAAQPVRVVMNEGSYVIEESDRGTFRFRCNSCRHHGRWLANGNVAKGYGDSHADRHNGQSQW